MTQGAADREWMRGYETARALCLTRGAETAHHDDAPPPNPAYEAGFDWGIWDYEDANGLPHPHERRA